MAVLGFFGGLSGFLIPNYYRSYADRSNARGAFYAAVGILYVPCIALGAQLPPLLLLLAHRAFGKALRRRRALAPGSSALQQQMDSEDPPPPMRSTLHSDSDSEPADASTAQQHRCRQAALMSPLPPAPGSEAVGGRRLRSTSTGNSVHLHCSRPDVGAFLARVKEGHAAEVQIPVLVGGPLALLEATREEVHLLNSGGGGEGPYLFFRRIASGH